MKRVIDTYEFVNVIVFVFRISPLWDRFSAIENFCGKLKFSRRATQQKLKCICTYCLLTNKKWYSSVFKRTCSKQRNQGSVRVHHPFMEGDSPRKYKTTAEAAADCRYVVSLVIWFPVQFIPRKHIVFFRSGEIGLGDRGEISTKHQEPTERARSSSEVSISIHSSVICRSNFQPTSFKLFVDITSQLRYNLQKVSHIVTIIMQMHCWSIGEEEEICGSPISFVQRHWWINTCIIYVYSWFITGRP